MLDELNTLTLHYPSPEKMSRSRSKASSVSSSDDIQDDPFWDEGDFTLISSDGWRFKAWSYKLFSAR